MGSTRKGYRSKLSFGPVLMGAICLTGCADEGIGETATLYRNSPLDTSVRVHFASFDADESGTFNVQNCDMVARLLNANVDASASQQGKERDPNVGFWCESGTPALEGNVPRSFDGEFPTDVRSEMRFSG